MKGDQIGEFEELLLLAVLAMVDTPSVVVIQQYLERARKLLKYGASPPCIPRS
jgi:hypothetical protein